MLHYASPPIIGGVESTIAHHARGLAALGYSIRVISGSGAEFDSRVAMHLEPLFSATHPDVLSVKSELDAGIVSSQFQALVERQQSALQVALQGCDICIVHNIHTMNKNLALTLALTQIRHPYVIAWCHDLAWANAQYQPELHDAYPWNTLRQGQPNTHYVTVSQERQSELAALLNIPSETISVIPPGIDPAEFFQWTDVMRSIESQLHLLDADGLLLLPARLTRRKNIAFGLHMLAAIRQQSGRDFRLIITGPPGPHNPLNPGYLGELLHLRETLHLADAAHFLYELRDPPLLLDDRSIANLYQIADALFFPSIQEGFGIPLLEAALAGIPIFCADIPPFRQTGQQEVHYFDPHRDSAETVATNILRTLQENPTYRIRVRVRQQFRWDRLIHTLMVPLLEKT